MRKYLRSRIEDLLEVIGVAGEVWNQDFHTRVGILLVNLTNGLGVEPRALIFEVISGNTGDCGIAQVHLSDGFTNAAGFVAVECIGLSGVDLAEVTATGALRTTYEEGCLTVFPTFIDVGATGFLTDSVKVFALHQFLECLVFRSHLGFGANPFRLLLNRSFAVTNFQAQKLAAIS